MTQPPEPQHLEAPPFDRRMLAGVALACAAMYLLSAVISAIMTGAGFAGATQFLSEPYFEATQILGAGGWAPISRSQFWVLIASGYLHASLSHIALNLLGLLMLLPPVQMSFGLRRSFVIYTAACIAGSAASAAWGEIYSLGASTGVFGLIGATAVIGLKIRGAWGQRFLTQAGILIVANFGMGLLYSDKVSNAGHFGGLIGGAAAAYALLYSGSLRGERLARLSFALALGATIICLTIGAGNGVYRSWQALEAPQDFVKFILDRRAQDDALIEAMPSQ